MYKVGDKVETPYGVCVVENYDKKLKIYHTKHHKTGRLFMIYEDSPEILGLYKLAHDKLIELGWEVTVRDKVITLYESKGTASIFVDCVYKYITTKIGINLELSRILTQYLEELE